MSKDLVVLCVMLLLSGLGYLGPPFAQDAYPPATGPSQERRMVAIGLVRTINTGELTYKHKHGSYGIWQALLSDESKYFDEFLSIHNLPRTNSGFGSGPEILPGWNLRLNVHTDGQGYDLLLEDGTDKDHGYAALSDERAVIRESKWLQ